MSDFINRQAAIDVLKDRYYKYGRFAKLEELVWVIENLPSVQPIQCKDCKHFVDNGEGNRLCTNPYTWVTSTDYDFGCIYAER